MQRWPGACRIRLVRLLQSAANDISDNFIFHNILRTILDSDSSLALWVLSEMREQAPALQSYEISANAPNALINVG